MLLQGEINLGLRFFKVGLLDGRASVGPIGAHEIGLSLVGSVQLSAALVQVDIVQYIAGRGLVVLVLRLRVLVLVVCLARRLRRPVVRLLLAAKLVQLLREVLLGLPVSKVLVLLLIMMFAHLTIVHVIHRSCRSFLMLNVRLLLSILINDLFVILVLVVFARKLVLPSIVGRLMALGLDSGVQITRVVLLDVVETLVIRRFPSIFEILVVCMCHI